VPAASGSLQWAVVTCYISEVQRRSSFIYLDNAATTIVHHQVASFMTDAMRECFANPSSRHGLGLSADRRVQDVRRSLASRLCCREEQVIFTSGGTEANALAILGTISSAKKKRHALVSAIEHPSIRATARMLERLDVAVEEIPVTEGGWVAPEEVKHRLRPETVLLAVMHVNNETGVLQPVEEISEYIKHTRPDCLFLVDAVQSFGHIPLDIHRLGADLLTLSAHKIHGPKGVGCLALGRDVHVARLWGGGDQEGGRRPGTENVPGIVGFGKAVEVCPVGAEHLAQLNRLFLEMVEEKLPQARALGDATRRAPHIVSLAFAGIPSEVLLNALEREGVIASSGSACHGRRGLHSHVLEAMRVPRHMGVVRFSFSRMTSEGEVREAAEILASVVVSLKDLPKRR
jgi:cysteine desulfurase